MQKIYVTKPSLPTLDEYIEKLRVIWDSSILTNSGLLHEQLETAVREYLGVEHISLVSNGTLALQIAIMALELKGEIITTPYSFVATAHSILLSGATPVFVDIDPVTCNLDPRQIEQAITSNTCAIMPVHVYGNPCDNEAIMSIAAKHNLKVIYDAAHAFGVRKNGQSVLNWGDVSTLSFHATKVFNTFEGGAIVCNSAEMKIRIDRLRNFGFVSEKEIIECGMNAKMNEAQAAMGLCLIDKVDTAILQRRKHYDQYSKRLDGVSGLRYVTYDASVQANYSYYPIFLSTDFPLSRDELFELLKSNNVFPRRYFYPLITDFSLYNNCTLHTSVTPAQAKVIAENVICLPMYSDLENVEIDFICDIIKEAK